MIIQAGVAAEDEEGLLNKIFQEIDTGRTGLEENCGKNLTDFCPVVKKSLRSMLPCPCLGQECPAHHVLQHCHSLVDMKVLDQLQDIL
jgi:hypothetical protein